VNVWKLQNLEIVRLLTHNDHPYTHTHTHGLLQHIALAYLVYMFSLSVQATELQFAQPKEWIE